MEPKAPSAPPTNGTVVNALYAWVMVNDDGDERVLTTKHGRKTVLLMDDNLPNVKLFRPLAQEEGNLHKRSVKLIRVSDVEVLKELEPRPYV